MLLNLNVGDPDIKKKRHLLPCLPALSPFMIAAFAAPAAPAALSPTLVSLRGTKGRQSNFINYFDANHLHGLAMSMKLPIGKLKWIKKILFRVVTKHANLKTYQKNLTAIWGLCRCNFPIWKLVDDLGGPPLGRCTRKVLLLRGARCSAWAGH